MAKLGIRLGRTVTGAACTRCGSTERYKKTHQCAPCARRQAAERRAAALAKAAAA